MMWRLAGQAKPQLGEIQLSAWRRAALFVPSAGMTPEESIELMNDIRRVRENYYQKLSMILVEHDMMVIEDITDRVVALNFGKKIADGTFEEVSRNEELKEAYLGK